MSRRDDRAPLLTLEIVDLVEARLADAGHRGAGALVRDALRCLVEAEEDRAGRALAGPTEAALRASEARLRVAVEAAHLSTWEFDLRSGTGSRAGPLTAILPGVPAEGFGLERWMEPIHPEERGTVERGFRAVAEDRAPRFAAEFRVRRPEGGWAWISSFGAVVERDPATGAPARIAGVARDVTERRLAEERRAVLLREVDHRAKNALAVVQATLRLTRAETVDAYRTAVEGRIAAISRAQTLLAEERWAGAELRDLLAGETEPFPGGDQRVRLDGPPVRLPPHAAQPLAMAVHELATNAARHGALSAEGGRVVVGWSLDEGSDTPLTLRWTETGGPALDGPPARRGLGFRVLEGSLRNQLGGSVAFVWEPDGLTCEIGLPLGLGAPRPG